jgi:hypothetical protein
MHPMTSVTLTHTHHAESQRLAARQRHGGDRTVRATHPTGAMQLRAMLRSAAELPQRLATTVRVGSRHHGLGDGLLEPCADRPEALGRLS